MALIANANRSAKRTTPFVPADFNPFEKKKRRTQGLSVTAQNIDLVANIICGKSDGK